VRSDNKVGLPQTYRYDSFNYSKNFDSRHWEESSGTATYVLSSNQAHDHK
jgi:hypothetical protein